jgi:TfoX N-terminal domain
LYLVKLRQRTYIFRFERFRVSKLLLAPYGIAQVGDATAGRLARLGDMAYDTELADRIRFLIGTGPGRTEKKMFGGLAFMIDGNMAISASGKGGALIRVDPADCGTLIETTTATPAIMGGREMPGWLRVSSDDLETDEQLTQWVSRAVSHARSLPPK